MVGWGYMRRIVLQQSKSLEHKHIISLGGKDNFHGPEHFLMKTLNLYLMSYNFFELMMGLLVKLIDTLKHLVMTGTTNIYGY